MPKTSRTRSALCAVLVCVGCLLNSGTGGAEPSATEKATADALFLEGKKLANEGRFVEACPRFEKSQALDPGVGTLLFLAECYEKTARAVDAYNTFKKAADLARVNKQAGREKIASDRAAALDARLAKLTIEVDASQEGVVEILRDNIAVPKEEYGVAVRLDNGVHNIVAKAKGKKSWTMSVEVNDRAAVRIKIPTLESESVASAVSASASASTVAPPKASVAPSSAISASPPIATSTPTSRSLTGTQKAMMVSGGVIAVVGIGLGSYFGVKALSDWNDSRDGCIGTRCNSAGYADGQSANRAATLSTVFFAVGAVGLGVGTVAWYWPQSEKKNTATIRLAPNALYVEGSYL